jgi:D-cysteine desulfhydrase family pyridoxal phosphate-dependent enzyme
MTHDLTADLRIRLEELPRQELAIAPTPIHDLPRLSDRLGVRVLVKRDDLTGLAFGGNKIRQLEFFVGEAVARGADVLVAGGSFAQSNHARACAAAARAAGLRSVILVRPGAAAGIEAQSGNALLTHLLADEVREVEALASVPRGDRLAEVTGRRAVFEAVADDLRAQGLRPYVLVGSSVPLGAMGYVAAALELQTQRRALGIDFSAVFVASQGVTQAGLELGSRLLEEPWRVIGIAYQPTDGRGAEWVRELMAGAADILGVEAPDGEVVNDEDSSGPAYGTPTAESREALALAARTDAVLVDPVYSAKGLAGLIRWVREGRIAQGETVLFLHTGGLPALFAYVDEVRAAA